MNKLLAPTPEEVVRALQKLQTANDRGKYAGLTPTSRDLTHDHYRSRSNRAWQQGEDVDLEAPP